jgi:hypothetical protein
VKTADYGAASSEINAAVLEAFRSRGINLPAPRDIRLLSTDAYVAGKAAAAA